MTGSDDSVALSKLDGFGVSLLCCVGFTEGVNVGASTVSTIVGVEVGGALLEAAKSNNVVGLADGSNVGTTVGVDVGGTLVVVVVALSKFDGTAVSNSGVGLAEGFNVGELAFDCSIVGAFDDDDDDDNDAIVGA